LFASFRSASLAAAVKIYATVPVVLSKRCRHSTTLIAPVEVTFFHSVPKLVTLSLLFVFQAL